MQKLSIKTLLIAFSAVLTSCGGGGGGTDQTGPALLEVDLAHSAIDSGDRTEVHVHLTRITEDRVILKARFPIELSFVRRSGIFIANGSAIDAVPDHNESDATNTYLVYFIDTGSFGLVPNGYAELVFELKGESDITEGLVEADIDLDDPRVSNLNEFNIDSPMFDAQTDASIRVGPAPSPSATP